MSQLGFSEWVSNTENNENNNSQKKPKNRTIKKMPSFKKLLNLEENIPKTNLTENFNNNDDDESGLADYKPDFQPPPQPVLSKIKQHQQMNNENNMSNDKSIDTEEYSKLDNLSNAQYYKQMAAPYFTNTSNSINDITDNKVVDKLNYLIHLMEEQKDEKTQNVTEELILYSFLGVFVIFVVDSFNKGGGRYTR